MLDTMSSLKGNMYEAAKRGFINATDLADYLTKRGMPFRSAYKICGEIVAECIAKGKTLDTLSMEEYKAHTDLFDTDLYKAISLEECIRSRISDGSTGYESVLSQIKYTEDFLKEHK
jgi:argininosuccinate lyase